MISRSLGLEVSGASVFLFSSAVGSVLGAPRTLQALAFVGDVERRLDLVRFAAWFNEE